MNYKNMTMSILCGLLYFSVEAMDCKNVMKHRYITSEGAEIIKKMLTAPTELFIKSEIESDPPYVSQKAFLQLISWGMAKILEVVRVHSKWKPTTFIIQQIEKEGGVSFIPDKIRSPLSYALYCKSIASVRWLLNAGCRADVYDQYYAEDKKIFECRSLFRSLTVHAKELEDDRLVKKILCKMLITHPYSFGVSSVECPIPSLLQKKLLVLHLLFKRKTVLALCPKDIFKILIGEVKNNVILDAQCSKLVEFMKRWDDGASDCLTIKSLIMGYLDLDNHKEVTGQLLADTIGSDIIRQYNVIFEQYKASYK